MIRNIASRFPSDYRLTVYPKIAGRMTVNVIRGDHAVSIDIWMDRVSTPGDFQETLFRRFTQAVNVIEEKMIESPYISHSNTREKGIDEVIEMREEDYLKAGKTASDFEMDLVQGKVKGLEGVSQALFQKAQTEIRELSLEEKVREFDEAGPG